MFVGVGVCLWLGQARVEVVVTGVCGSWRITRLVVGLAGMCLGGCCSIHVVSIPKVSKFLYIFAIPGPIAGSRAK